MNSRFILAFPSNGGHNWQYWFTYSVDFEKGVIDYHRGSHGDERYGLTVSYQNSHRCIDLLQGRRMGKKTFFVSSGMVVTKGQRIPIRFDPVKMAFGTGEVSRAIPEYNVHSLEAVLDRALNDYTDVTPDWRGGISYIMRKGMARLALAAELKKVFDQLSYSQFVYTARDPFVSADQMPSCLKLLYAAPRLGGYREALDAELETVYPSPVQKPSRKDIARCVRRFVARHPTRATKTLLSLLAGAAALKAA